MALPLLDVVRSDMQGVSFSVDNEAVDEKLHHVAAAANHQKCVRNIFSGWYCVHIPCRRSH